METLESKRKATTITLPLVLLQDARASQLNISQVAEKALREALARVRADQWAKANRDGITEYNSRIEASGPSLQPYRTW